MNIEDIRNSIKKDDYEIQLHALERMGERDISLTDVQTMIDTGEIIETYADDQPFPSCLIFSIVEDRPLHAVVAYDKSQKKSHIITVYEPDKGEFEDDFQTRR
jgi:hypothetical protein